MDKPDHVDIFLKELLLIMKEYQMFLRIAVCSTDDSNEPFYEDRKTNIIKSSKNHVLANRLGCYFEHNGHEDLWNHSLMMTCGCFKDLWHEEIPETISSNWNVFEINTHEDETLEGVNIKYLKFISMKLNEREIKTLSDFS
jgi:hypothetical protein